MSEKEFEGAEPRELAHLRFPGLATFLEESTDILFSRLGGFSPGESEIEGPERLQEYYGLSDEIMAYLFHQDAPETTVGDILDADTKKGANIRIESMFSEEDKLLEAAGELFKHFSLAESEQETS